AGRRARLADRLGQALLGHGLDALVERQKQVAARSRRFDRRALVAIAQRVEVDVALAGLARQRLLILELDAGLALVIERDEPEDVRGHRALRVVALVLALEVQALDVQRPDALDFARLGQPLNPLEAARAQLGLDDAGILAQD